MDRGGSRKFRNPYTGKSMKYSGNRHAYSLPISHGYPPLMETNE
jgi:hypothetical protein